MQKDADKRPRRFYMPFRFSLPAGIPRSAITITATAETTAATAETATTAAESSATATTAKAATTATAIFLRLGL